MCIRDRINLYGSPRSTDSSARSCVLYQDPTTAWYGSGTHATVHFLVLVSGEGSDVRGALGRRKPGEFAMLLGTVS
eukprot:160119-Rhodomonas_salina.2